MSGRTVAAPIAGIVAITLVLTGCTRATFSPAAKPTATATATPSAGPGGLAGGAKDGVGSDGIGDPYLPKAGNGGYDVASYALDLRYQPKDDTLTGVATITATATADLTQFNLDFKDLTVESATVDGAPARTRPSDEELVVTPAARITSGARFVVEIRYGGVPKPYQEPPLGEIGFLHTGDGAIAIGEPQVAASWYPVNDHPRDKATYTVTIAAPSDVVALSNGVLKKKTTAGGFTTWSWVESRPMAPYLATIVIGRYRLTQGTHDGKPVVTAVHSSLPTYIDREMRRTAEIVDFLETRFGPYPFDAMGGIVVDDGRIRFALENQSRPIYGQVFFDSGGDATWVIAHELAHQWYGDSVSVENWNEIWLNEGFATYAEWLWDEHRGSRTAQDIFDRLYDAPSNPLWATPPGAPGADRIFSDSVYTRGGMTLHALRMTVGDEAFFRILKAWSAEQAYGNATTAEFIAVAERISGRQLDQLFTDWLYEKKRPPRPGR
jgi:aminopeptidase N